ncbi:MAG: SUMF1/EgtB/PvdO family nonheme iron enzyme [Deltaproteobacteria bacterium]|nr:SUMF1/EgtB/PvdO family nonheme iron enzyme [Deltaproteobacteria bacterium]
MRIREFILCGLGAVLAAGCSCGKGGEESTAGEDAPDAAAQQEEPGPPVPAVQSAKAPEKKNPAVEIPDLGDDVLEIAVPAATLRCGSRTGAVGRDPASEMDLVEMELSAFRIDRYPYPNQKGAAPRTGVTLGEARSLCEAEGKRLCTELEWEAACKGPAGAVYPYGFEYEAGRYGAGLDVLASGYGAAGFGAQLEWTDSTYRLPENPTPRGQVVRGGSPEAGAAGRRCAKRGYRMADKASSLVAFRCCSGGRNEAEVTLEPLKKPFQEVKDMAAAKFVELVKVIPELSRVHGDPKMFGESDLSYVLMRRNIDPRKSYPGYIFTASPVWWHPVRGEELLAFTGYSGKDSFIAGLYHLGGGRFKHAASMVLLGKGAITYKTPVPVILVAGVDRDVLNWGPCWNCSEGGALYISEETGTIEISHRW